MSITLKKAKEDAEQKKSDDEAAQKMKAEEDAPTKKAEAKRQEDLNNHMTQPPYMLTQAQVKIMKDNPDLRLNGRVVYIPASTTKQWKFSFTRSALLSWVTAESRM